MSEELRAAIAHGVYWDSVRRYQHAGIYAVAVYDWLLCLKDEQPWLFSRGISRAKFAYALCRYWPLISHPVNMWITVVNHKSEPDLCGKIFRWPMIMQLGNIIGVALIIIIRVHAFLGGQPIVALFLGACLCAVVAYQLWTALAKAGNNPAIGCVPIDVEKTRYLAGYIIAPLLFDVIAFAITMAHAFCGTPAGAWKSTGSFYTRIFLRDGIAYFAAIVVVHIINVALNNQPDRALAGAGMGSSLLLPNILACRLLLHLRSASPPLPQTSLGSTHVAFSATVPALPHRTISRTPDPLSASSVEKTSEEVKDAMELREYGDARV